MFRAYFTRQRTTFFGFKEHDMFDDYIKYLANKNWGTCHALGG